MDKQVQHVVEDTKKKPNGQEESFYSSLILADGIHDRHCYPTAQDVNNLKAIKCSQKSPLASL